MHSISGYEVEYSFFNDEEFKEWKTKEFKNRNDAETFQTELYNRKNVLTSHLNPIVKCCNSLLVCNDSWTNVCDRCGSEYDHNGTLLASREFWGEETGEQF